MQQTFNEIVGAFEKRMSASSLFPAQPATLYDPCKYIMSLGGKRVRPAVCLMANELFGDLKSEAWDAAIAIELFHNFTLIHDDIMDKAPLRRGFPTVHAKYGLTAGILGGDAMSIYAYQSLAKVQTNFREVLEVFNTTAIQVCDGQQMDMDFEIRDAVSIDEYIEMITLKTSVLLAASLKIGALIAGASCADAELLYAFGKNLGIAFQLQDDYLDAFGVAAKLGKQQGGDIIANKKTYLHLEAVNHASAEQLAQIKHLMGSEDYEHKVRSMLQIFEATDAHSKCRDAVALYSNRSFESLEALGIPKSRKIHLEQLAFELLNREQ